MARGRRLHRARRPARELLRRQHPARRSRRRGRVADALHGVQRPSAAWPERSRLRPRMAASGSRTTARSASASATAAASTTRDPTGRSSARWSIRSTRRTASGCRPTESASTSRRPSPGASGSGTSSRRARSPRACRSRRAARRCSPASPASSCSTRSRSTRDGNVCVATLVNGGITVLSTFGEVLEHVATGDPLTTNICFGGRDLPHGVHHLLRHRASGRGRAGRVRPG